MLIEESSVVIRNLDIVRITLAETKADSPLVIDRDRVLSLSIANQRMQSVARRHPKILETSREIDVLELPSSASKEVGRKAPSLSSDEQRLRFAIGERLDHPLYCILSRDTFQQLPTAVTGEAEGEAEAADQEVEPVERQDSKGEEQAAGAQEESEDVAAQADDSE